MPENRKPKTENRHPTRRDWFRLRQPRQPKMLDDSSSSDRLQPIANPPNHDGMNLDELPPMSEATLSQEEVTDLFSDIGQLGTDIQLMQRSVGAARATASKANDQARLEQAKEALFSSSVQRIQVRYRWRDQLWIDTLKRDAPSSSYHLIRIAHRQTP